MADLRVRRIELVNWMNFRKVDVLLSNRVFIVGPNACGKSNFLDAFKFLRDICAAGGGLQRAVSDRGGLRKIRALTARRPPTVEITVEFSEFGSDQVSWRYSLGILQESRGRHHTYVEFERVWFGNKLVLNRPDDLDKSDPDRRLETHLEHIGSNKEFRVISKYLSEISYLHLVPQLVRKPESFQGPGVPANDPYGRNFLEKIASTPANIKRSRLTRIEKALQAAVPQLTHLTDTTDSAGVPHLEAMYQHWRPAAGKQREDQFSDGTIRLIGLLWALLESDSLLLLEEPELSLNSGIIRKIPELISGTVSFKKKQVLVSTHSLDLLTSYGIGPEEVILLSPSSEGTTAVVAAGINDVHSMLLYGSTLADALQPKMTPRNVNQIELKFK